MTLCLYFWIPLAWSFLSTFSALYYSVCFSCWMNKCKHLNLSSLHRKSFSRMMFSRRLQCVGSISDRCCLALWIQRTAPQNQPAAQRHDTRYSSTSQTQLKEYLSKDLLYACSVTIPFLVNCFLSVSEAPKEAPVRKYLALICLYLEEKTDWTEERWGIFCLSVCLSFLSYSFVLFIN